MPVNIPNNTIACEPFESLSIETSGKAFVTVKQKNSALKTKVVYPTMGQWADPTKSISPGDTVYIRGTDSTLPYVKDVFEIGGKKVILVPIPNILAVESDGFFNPFQIPQMAPMGTPSK